MHARYVFFLSLFQKDRKTITVAERPSIYAKLRIVVIELIVGVNGMYNWHTVYKETWKVKNT